MNENFKSKTDVVYEKLRKRIMTGKMKPGEKIIISNLSKELGCSGMPVREAIRKLESEGYIKIIPNVGAEVTQWDPRETMEIYRVRVELESIATKWAMPHLNDTDIGALEKLITQMDAAAQKKDYGKLSALNRNFHLKIYQACQCAYLCRLIEELWDKVHRRNLFAYAPERVVGSMKEHKEMLQAIKNHDEDLMDSLLRGQKKNSLEFLMKNFEVEGK